MGVRLSSLSISFLTCILQAMAFRAFPNTKILNENPISESTYKEILKGEDMNQLKKACKDSLTFNLDFRLRAISNRIEEITLGKDIDEVLENAQALMDCKAPKRAQVILKKIKVVEDSHRRDWLILSWEAAYAAIDHSSAAFALFELVNGEIDLLDLEQLVVGYSSDGIPIKKSALDLFAEHERSLGKWETSAKALLSGRISGELGARRLLFAVQLLENASKQKKMKILNTALLQASKDKAWWLAEDILRLQLVQNIVSKEKYKLVKNDLEKLVKDLDDKYTLLEILKDDLAIEEHEN